MKVQCERRKEEKDCKFYGPPADPENEKAQAGAWICDDCVGPIKAELDKAIANLEKSLED